MTLPRSSFSLFVTVHIWQHFCRSYKSLRRNVCIRTFGFVLFICWFVICSCRWLLIFIYCLFVLFLRRIAINSHKATMTLRLMQFFMLHWPQHTNIQMANFIASYKPAVSPDITFYSHAQRRHPTLRPPPPLSLFPPSLFTEEWSHEHFAKFPILATAFAGYRCFPIEALLHNNWSLGVEGQNCFQVCNQSQPLRTKRTHDSLPPRAQPHFNHSSVSFALSYKLLPSPPCHPTTQCRIGKSWRRRHPVSFSRKPIRYGQGDLRGSGQWSPRQKARKAKVHLRWYRQAPCQQHKNHWPHFSLYG